jgi:Cdc6-like AAA superfamily ATPase
MTDEHNRAKARAEAARVFTPAVPVGEADLFAGRLRQIQRVVDVINQRGQHAVIFGERGVGKTSLANIIGTRLAAGTEVVAPRINCDSTDDFASIWRKVLAQIEITRTHRPAGFRSDVATASLPAASSLGETVAPDDVRRMLAALAGSQVVVVILDEFDRLVSQPARRAVADTIKTLADHDVAATIVVVGVAETVDELIAEHRSIERALVQIPMCRMNVVELEAVVQKGVAKLELSIEPAASARIARLSQGLPHFTHALSLHAVRAALDEGSQTVRLPHVHRAIAQAVSDSTQSLVRRLADAGVGRRSDELTDHVLLACAVASARGAGDFSAADVRDGLSAVTGQPVEGRAWQRHLEALCRPAAGPVLLRTGEGRRVHYRFAEPLLQPVLIMRGLVDGRIDDMTVPDWLGTESPSPS